MCFDMFFPSPEKLTFGCKKCIFSSSFGPRWLKHTSFCREFNCQQRRVLQKKYFPSVSIKKNNTKPQTIAKSVKFWIFFSTFHFSKEKKTSKLRCAPSLCK